MNNMKMTKIQISVFGIKLFLALAIPGVIAAFMIYTFLWYFDLSLIENFTKNVTEDSNKYTIVIILTTLLFCFILIFNRVAFLVKHLIRYIEGGFTSDDIIKLKKNIISVIPHLLKIAVLSWIISDGLICILFIIIGQNFVYMLRSFFISTMFGVFLTSIPAYFALDTIIKNFIRNFFEEVYLQEYSDIKTISITLKIFTVFLVGGVLPTSIVFITAHDYMDLVKKVADISPVITENFSVAVITSLVVSIIIPLASAVYFYITLARPIRNLDKTMRAIDGGNLNIKLKTDFTDEIGHISQGFNNMIQRVRESVRVHEELALIEKELDIAEKVQCSVLTQPGEYENIEDYSISVLYKPQNGRVGGDYFNISRQKNGSISVFIADATGHGMQAALTTMQIDMMNKQSLHLVDPAERFKFLNDYYTSELKGQNLFTACCVNLYKDHITYGGAGQPRQYILRSGNDLVTVDKTGKLIGAFPGFTYRSSTYQMEKNDILVLFTDGAFEQYNEKEEIFNEDRLKQLIIENSMKIEVKSDFKQFGKLLFNDIYNFTGSRGLDDDVTIICIRKD